MTYLSSDIGKAVVTALTGTLTVYPVMARAGSPAPFGVYNVLTNNPDYWKDSGSPVDYISVILSVYHSTYLGLALLVQNTRVALERYSNATYHIDSTTFITEQDEYDQDSGLFVKNMEFKFRIYNS